MLTLDEIIEKLLAQYDPDDIILLLDITSEEILDQFSHKIENRLDRVLGAIEYEP